MTRRLQCLLGRHQWRTEWNLLTQGTESECLRCGARRSTFPGDPSFRAPHIDGARGGGEGRPGGGGGGVGGDGGGGGGDQAVRVD